MPSCNRHNYLLTDKIKLLVLIHRIILQSWLAREDLILSVDVITIIILS